MISCRAEAYTMGERVGQYELDDEPLAIGGMGAVFRARDARGRRVAIKRMHPALAQFPEAVERVRREAAALVRLQGHPHIVRVLDLIEHPLAIAMEYLEGESFDDILGREAHLPLPWILAHFRQVAEAVAHAHSQSILHRDLKPANVMLARMGDQQVAKVLDFGLARLAEGPRGLTQDGQRMGTPEYMAPEQHRGEAVDPRTDVYALGVLLFAFLTGRPPFELGSVAYPSDYAVARAHLEEPLPAPSSRRPDVPAWLDDVVARATQKAPRARFASVRALLDACVEPKVEPVLVVGPAPVVAPAPVAQPVRPPAPRSPPPEAATPAPPGAQPATPPWLAWVVGGTLVVAGLGLLWMAVRESPARPGAPVAEAPPTQAPPTTAPADPAPPPPALPPCATPDACRVAAGAASDPAEKALFEAEGCRLGDWDACVTLASRHSEGKGIAQDRVEAARLRRLACEGGHAQACNDLGHQHQTGRGVAKDAAEALRLYILACDRGYPLACSNAGNHQRDPAVAAGYFRRACEAPCDLQVASCRIGRTAGCRRLGDAHSEGEGVPLDPVKGRELNQWACDQGNQEACKKLGTSSQ